MTAGLPKGLFVVMIRSSSVRRHPANGLLSLTPRSGVTFVIRGVFTAASAMLSNSIKMDVIANNLSNCMTAGFKRQGVSFASFPGLFLRRINDTAFDSFATALAGLPPIDPRPAVGWLDTGMVAREVATDYSTGRLRKTDGKCDLAIEGEGFFVIDTPWGRRYTRNGEFRLNLDGYLCTSEGFRVVGDDGPIQVSTDEFYVRPDGSVWSGGRIAGRLTIVGFSYPERLLREGSALFDGTNAGPFRLEGSRVVQGFLELPNFEPVREMVELIEVMRSYESSQRLIKAQDETLGKAVNEVGRLG